ncbi:MAG: bifunctional pyr operon transcriptional regulator/uracil phosphoribosyltransferase PyrR [Acidobacteriota bacterium]
MSPQLVTKSHLLDSSQMARVMRRMAVEVVERNGGVENLVLVGIRTRGVPLADFMAKEIEKAEGVSVPQGILDITLYRDDLSTIAPQPVVKESHLPEAIEGVTLVLCDDVLYTGRTIRAALDALMDYGRPKAVQLAVLIDRGHRELPIQADFIGQQIQTSDSEVIKVTFADTDDGDENVRLLDRPASEAEPSPEQGGA